MSHHRARMCLAGIAALGCVCVLAGCFGSSFHWPWESVAPPHSTPAGPLSAREEFASLLDRLQWIFIGLGIAGVVASIWLPIISTRQAVGALVIGIGVALVKPWIIALYYPVIVALAVAGLAAAWPYLHAAYVWGRARFTGQQPELTAGLDSIKSLWTPRAKLRKPPEK